MIKEKKKGLLYRTSKEDPVSRAGKISPALKAHVLNAYREIAPSERRAGAEFNPTYLNSRKTEHPQGSEENFEEGYVRCLDETGTNYELAGDLISAANSRIKQADRYLADGEKYKDSISAFDYWNAGLLYEAGGEIQKALEAVNRALKQKDNGNFRIMYREEALKKRGKLEEKLEAHRKRIEKKRLASLTVSIMGIIGIFLFFSFGITGKAIADYNLSMTNVPGIILLILIFVLGFSYLVKRRRNVRNQRNN